MLGKTLTYDGRHREQHDKREHSGDEGDSGGIGRTSSPKLREAERDIGTVEEHVARVERETLLSENLTPNHFVWK